jgi:PAS domain S-box-containing protein
MLLRRKIELVVSGLALGALVAGFVAGLVLWYAWAGVAPSVDAASSVPLLLQRGLWIVGGVTALTLAGAAAGGWWLLRSLQHSVSVLQDAVEQVQTGRLDANIEVDAQDELGRVARSLNRMTTTLSQHTVSRSYLHAVLDSMAELLFVVDADGRIQRANQAAAETLDRSPDDLRGTPLAQHFDTDPLTAHGSANGAPTVECTLSAPDGDARPVLVSRSRLQGGAPGDGEIVCVAQDISERKAIEDQLRQSLDEKEVLLREIHHRVKNNLQVISSLLHVQAQDVDDPDVRQRFVESQERIRSMAAIHEQLYQSDNLAQVDFKAYLDELLDHLFRSHHTRGITPSLDADAVPLPIDQAIPAGLIVNELVSNALEHAFSDDQTGSLSVHFHVEADTGTLVVADDGSGANVEVLEAGSSLGLRLVRGLVRQLDGTLSLDTDGGLAVTITFPVNSPD